MVAMDKFIAMPILLLLLVICCAPLRAAKNPLSISLDAVAKPLRQHALSHPKETKETFRRGIEFLTDRTDDEVNEPRQKQYPSFSIYRTKLSIRLNTNAERSSQGNIAGRTNAEQKSVTALVDISSPVVWMQGIAPLSTASNYYSNSSCWPSNFPRGSGAPYAADFVFPRSVSNIKFVYDETKRVDHSDGILAVFGFSNNSCSLLRQLGYSNFSYCFAPNSSQSSAILLGSEFRLRHNSEHQPAQLFWNNQFSSEYSVNLTGISVGFTEVPVTAFPFQENGPVTMILDSVNPVTLLKRELYESIKKEFLSQMNQMDLPNATSPSLGLDLCFTNPPYWPQLALRFSPAATMYLSRENYVVRDLDTGIECLAILPSQDVSVMGTMLQVNHLMMFDVARSTLSFDQVNCGELSVSSAPDTSLPHRVTMVHHLSLVATFFAFVLVMG